MRRCPWLVMLVLLGACRTVPSNTNSGDALPLLPPTAQTDMRVSQVLQGEYGESRFNLRTVVINDGRQLTVIGITALGLRAFKLVYDGQSMQEERAPQVPQALQSAQLLNDLQLVFWPLSALQQAWRGAGLEVEEPYAGTRRLLRAGQLLAEVHYGSEVVNGRVWLRHFDHPYSLFMENAPLAQ